MAGAILRVLVTVFLSVTVKGTQNPCLSYFHSVHNNFKNTVVSSVATVCSGSSINSPLMGIATWQSGLCLNPFLT